MGLFLEYVSISIHFVKAQSINMEVMMVSIYHLLFRSYKIHAVFNVFLTKF